MFPPSQLKRLRMPPWRLGVSVLCGALLLAAAVAAQQNFPRTRLNAGIHVIEAELAITPEQRTTGLMYRQSLDPNQGMLFVFEQPAVQCFWMKNTLVPLTIAFLADDGSLVNLADMKPHTTDSHCSSQPVRYALEMNRGWFAKRGIRAGFKLNGRPFSATPQR